MIVVIRGLPGAGKSTYAKKHFPNALILENDMFHIRGGMYSFDSRRQQEAVEWCIAMATMSALKGMDVVVANTFVHRKYIETYRRLAEATNQWFKVIRLETQYGSIHNVPENVLKNMREGFEDWEGEEIVSADSIAEAEE